MSNKRERTNLAVSKGQKATKPNGRRRRSATIASADSHDPSAPDDVGFPIAGIGASAGGLEAFLELLTHLPHGDVGMAIVLVQHLDPTHSSALTEILARKTALPVHEAADNLRAEVNHVYVIPPNTALSISNGILKVEPRSHTGPQRSIDFFLKSLAKDKKERAIGVILSGTATDGTLGMEAIKAEGGITFAQNESARYDSMPRSAIASGCVDFVLKPKDIAQELSRIAKHPFVTGSTGFFTAKAVKAAAKRQHDDTPLPSGRLGMPPTGVNQARAETEGADDRSSDKSFKKILLLLRNHSGVDFTLYKSATIQRRIIRRMVLTRQNSIEDYALFLRGNAKELDTLWSDLLISVTSFFRNPEAFDVLKYNVFPTLLKERSEYPVRVWVLGCSTGQEAYSIAIAFDEAAESTRRTRKLQVFATDLNDTLLDKARRGLYDRSVAHDISQERRRRFFVEENGGYRVNKRLRETVVFARQNLISDPPFSHMDLVSCRNLMIYLESDLQRKLIPTFHYALNPGGYLFLGASESVAGFGELFAPLDKKFRIYTRKDGPTPAYHLPLKSRRREYPPPQQSRHARLERPTAQETGGPESFRAETSAQREADRITVNKYAPAGVLVNAALQILQFRGPTSAYFEAPTGNATFEVLKMARDGLMLPLRAALNKAKKENKPTRKENVRVRQNGSDRTVNLVVIPLKNIREHRFFLILFEDPKKNGRTVSDEPIYGPAAKQPRSQGMKQAARRIADLERDLVEARDYLQSIQEQNEAGNEELQASNEEVQSANEELQSLNEELETSKEELESTNEELTTVNEEMATRNAELNRLNSDLVNLQTSTNLAILLLARDLTIRSFSTEAEKTFHLLAGDVGRPIGAIRHDLDVADLGDLAADAIASLRERQLEVRDRKGRWYSLRVRPYLTLDKKVDGAVIVLVDIDILKKSEETLAAARDYAANTVNTVREPLLVLDEKLRVESANRSFYRVFGVSPDETVGKYIYSLGNGQWNIPRLRSLLEQILPSQNALENFEVEHEFDHIGRRTMLLNAARLLDPERNTKRILLAIEDISDRKQYLAQIKAAREQAEAIIATVRDPLLVLDAEMRVQTASAAFYKAFKVSPSKTVDHSIFDLGIGQWQIPELRRLLADVIPRNSFFDDFEVTRDFEGVGRRTVLLYGRRLGDSARILLGIHDVTEALQFQALVRQEQTRYVTLVKASAQIVWTTDAQGMVAEDSPSWRNLTGQTYDQLKGLGWLNALHPDDRDRVSKFWSRTVADRSQLDTEYRIRRADGDWRWMAARAVPLFGTDGSLREWIGMDIDITERKTAESEVRESEYRYRTLFDLGPVAIYSCDSSGVIQEFNRRAAELWGREPNLGDTEEQFCGAFRLFHPDGSFMPHEQSPMAEVVDGKIPDVHDAEVQIERPDGSRISVIVNIRPLKDQHGDITGAINCFYDISERKKSELRQSLLAKELAHRGKNLLTVVEVIISRSLSGTRSLGEAHEVLRQRIRSLARSQTILASATPEGAPVADIIRLEFEAFSDRVEVSGPSLMLNARAAQTFSLLLHELATNATKYGALSQPGGRVAIHWKIEGEGDEARFKFQWQESGGPPVQPPVHRGFGRTLVENVAAHEFGTPPKIEFALEGLKYEINSPLSAVAGP